MLSLAKAHAYGNDFLFIPHEQAEGFDPHALARVTCARHTGIGGDGLILYTVAPDASARMTLYNADGSPSELSGNGVRCLAALIFHLRFRRGERAPISEVRVETDAGWKAVTLVARNGGRYTFRAAMGQPAELDQEMLDVGGESLKVTTLRMGNPQCVALVSDLPDPDRFARLGPAISTHPRFAAGTNVEFARFDGSRLHILIWERGVGPTQASGTGACAAAVAAAAFGGANRSLDIVAPGGTQRVTWSDEGLWLTGESEVIGQIEWWP